MSFHYDSTTWKSTTFNYLPTYPPLLSSLPPPLIGLCTRPRPASFASFDLTRYPVPPRVFLIIIICLSNRLNNTPPPQNAPPHHFFSDAQHVCYKKGKRKKREKISSENERKYEKAPSQYRFSRSILFDVIDGGRSSGFAAAVIIGCQPADCAAEGFDKGFEKHGFANARAIRGEKWIWNLRGW